MRVRRDEKNACSVVFLIKLSSLFCIRGKEKNEEEWRKTSMRSKEEEDKKEERGKMEVGVEKAVKLIFCA